MDYDGRDKIKSEDMELNYDQTEISIGGVVVMRSA